MSSTPEIQFAETPLLNIAYERRGTGTPALLLHGWPDSPRTWDKIAPALLENGYSTIAPYTRGYGQTSFKDAATERSGQVTAQAQDVIDLMDALGIEKAVIVGHDWGCIAGYALAALWPERVERLVVMSVGYETGVMSGKDVEPVQGRAFWYQWLWNTDRGREALQGNHLNICRFLWQTWAPSFNFSEEEFQSTAESWNNSDWVEFTLHAYRVRWGAASKDERYASLEAQLQKQPKITVPTTVLHGEEDAASLVNSSEGQEFLFKAAYRREVLLGVGHFIPREAPQFVINAVLNPPSS